MRQAQEETAISEVCRKARDQRGYVLHRPKQYAGLMPSELKQLRQLEEENGKLKKLVADLSLDKAMLHEVLSKTVRPARRRALVNEVRAGWKVSIGRACRVLRTDTLIYHYNGRRTSQAGLTKRIKEIVETRVRYGYRRIHVPLRREGWPVNAKRIDFTRIWA